jgi:hypothetical protein
MVHNGGRFRFLHLRRLFSGTHDRDFFCAASKQSLVKRKFILSSIEYREASVYIKIKNNQLLAKREASCNIYGHLYL